MKLQSLFLRTSLLVSAVILSSTFFSPRASAQSNAQAAGQSSFAQTPSVPARITQAIDETQLVRLKGNVHPLARPEFDQGVVPDSTPMNRMLIVLQRSPEQQAALSKLMDEQLSKDSPNYHKWLTPQQFGAQFGPADADIQVVTDWLTRQGFQRIKVAAGRTVIEFSGNVGQVRNAFHTEIHRYLVNGEMRQANSMDPQIPAALTPVVAGTVTLHDFPRKSFHRTKGPFPITAKALNGRIVPDFTISGLYIVGPADFAKIYNVPNGLNGTPATLDGTGVTIALVADSNINPQDVVDFRNLFGLSNNNFSSANIILDGPDPGLSVNETEADLDVQTAGMVAPAATIKLVVSEGTLTVQGPDLSALYIVDNNIADVLSESFGACEAQQGANENLFLNALWEQAAAQGISVMVASGDSGSAGCDDPHTQTTAALGLAVSGNASTPFNVAVGGTDFDDVGTQTSFWSSTNATGTRESALGYIHEIPWNNSCAAAATSTNLNTVCASANTIFAGSGGPSSVYSKPPWQSGGTPPITPADGHRDLPDVSLFASIGSPSNSSYLLCEADLLPPGTPCVTGGSLFQIGGTSASSPAFAGIMALIVQQQGGRQGNPNPVLYKIAQSETFSTCNSSTTPLIGSATCVFYDVTKGNISVPCAVVSGVPQPTCSNQTGANGVLVTASGSTTPAWTTAAGYDMATGLGSVNVTNLAAAWKTTVGAFKPTTTATKINGGTAQVTINHGQSVTLSATVTSGSGTPTGDVSFLAPNPPVNVNGGLGPATLNGSGTATLTSPSAIAFALPGGSYSLKAHYAGDGNFAPSDDAIGVPVKVAPEPSKLQYSIITFDPVSGNVTNTNATSFAYGSPYILRFDILNSSGSACNLVVVPPATPVSAGCALDATGTVTIMDNGSALTCSPLVPGCTSPFPVNSEGSGEDQPIQLTAGAHTLSATYSGDISYDPVTTAVTDTVTVSKAMTASALAANPASGVTTATPVVLTASIATSSGGNGPSGTVTFFDGGTQIGSPASVTPANATSTAFASGTASLTNTFTMTGTHNITATYNGDTNYTTSSATAISITVNSSGLFTVSGAAVTVAAGSSGMSSITVTPSGGFTGTVNVTCTPVSPATSLPPGVTCSPNPLAINVTSASPVANNLTVAVATPSSSTTASLLPAERKLYFAGFSPTTGGKGWWGLSAITGVAAILLLLFPGRKRYRAVLGLALICVLSFTLGCSSGYNGGGGGPSTTTTQLTVSSTKVPATGTLTVSATVSTTGSHTPTGTVQFMDGTTALGSPVTLSNGSTGQIMVTAQQAPAFFQLVGTHTTVSVKYSGDTYNSASQSGALSITVTGSTTLGITGTSGSTTANGTINLTIN